MDFIKSFIRMYGVLILVIFVNVLLLIFAYILYKIDYRM